MQNNLLPVCPNFSQLLCHLLAPVTNQVPEHIADYSNAHTSFRAHVKDGVSPPHQVRGSRSGSS